MINIEQLFLNGNKLLVGEERKTTINGYEITIKKINDWY